MRNMIMSNCESNKMAGGSIPSVKEILHEKSEYLIDNKTVVILDDLNEEVVKDSFDCRKRTLSESYHCSVCLDSFADSECGALECVSNS